MKTESFPNQLHAYCALLGMAINDNTALVQCVPETTIPAEMLLNYSLDSIFRPVKANTQRLLSKMAPSGCLLGRA